MKILLVRHGETTWNIEGRYQGRRESPLSDRGLAQAQALAQRLRAENIKDVLSSPLSRAYDTARICAQSLGLPVVCDDSLIEISHGTWEGKLRPEIERSDAALLRAWQETPELVTFPGGESLKDVRQRLDAFLAKAPHYGGPLLAVTHDVIVRLAVLRAQGCSALNFTAVTVDNAAVNEFTLAEGNLRLERLNDVEHLGALRSYLASQAR